MQTDIVIVGAGPAGIFTALEMLRRGSRAKIVLVEKGQSIENRSCPKAKTNQCLKCKPYCHITTGFSGAGAFSVPRCRMGQSTSCRPARMARLRISLTSSLFPTPSTRVSAPNSR